MTIARTTTVRGLRLAYVDFGGEEMPVLALHGHFGRALSFAGPAAALAPEYRRTAGGSCSTTTTWCGRRRR